MTRKCQELLVIEFAPRLGRGCFIFLCSMLSVLIARVQNVHADSAPQAPSNLRISNGDELPPPLEVGVSVGQPRHTWDTLLGGVIWLPTRLAAKNHALALAEYSREVLIDIKSPSNGFGYRFDLNFWEPTASEYSWFLRDGSDAHEPTNLDDIFQIYDKANSRFILHLPMPRPGGNALSYPWQRAEFYAAECQYLFGTAGALTEYSTLATKLDFYSQPANFNWANLRARRGRVQPYKVEAIIFGEEPYHIEDWGPDQGGAYGVLAESYRKELRARSVTLPYGVHVNQLPPSDTSRLWFHPMLNSLSKVDPPIYLDLYHYYSFDANKDWLRSFPIARRAEGFTNWWRQSSTWRADYSRYLWLIEDARLALSDRQLNPLDYKLGFSEHGITTSTAFKFNDMMGALHWANWISEVMRTNTAWDSMWVLGAEGFSTAQLQYFSGKLTRTPSFYVYQMAAKLKNLRYVDSEVSTPYGAAQTPQQEAVYIPWVTVRAFLDEAKGERHLFAINQHSNASFTLTGFDGWGIVSWEQLAGASYESGNSLEAGATPTIKSGALLKPRFSPLTLDPISVNHIVLALNK